MAYPFAPVKELDRFRWIRHKEIVADNNPKVEHQTQRARKATSKSSSDKPTSK